MSPTGCCAARSAAVARGRAHWKSPSARPGGRRCRRRWMRASIHRRLPARQNQTRPADGCGGITRRTGMRLLPRRLRRSARESARGDLRVLRADTGELCWVRAVIRSAHDPRSGQPGIFSAFSAISLKRNAPPTSCARRKRLRRSATTGGWRTISTIPRRHHRQPRFSAAARCRQCRGASADAGGGRGGD